MRAITEAEGVHKEWYSDDKRMALSDLPAFFKHLTEDYSRCCALTARTEAPWSNLRLRQV